MAPVDVVLQVNVKSVVSPVPPDTHIHKMEKKNPPQTEHFKRAKTVNGPRFLSFFTASQ